MSLAFAVCNGACPVERLAADHFSCLHSSVRQKLSASCGATSIELLAGALLTPLCAALPEDFNRKPI